jgi:hypothetical protein
MLMLFIGVMIIKKVNDFLQSNGGNYLEIGVYHGETFFEIAKANPTTKVYGIDPFISDGWTGQHKGTVLSDAEVACNEKLLQFPNAHIFKSTSKQFAGSPFDAKGFNISVVFVDGSHWFDDVLIDTELAMKLIGQKKGLLIYDDLHIAEVRRGIKEATDKYPNLVALEDSRAYLEVGGIFAVN